jgi:hypothetical protein
MPRLSERFISRARSPQMKSQNSRCPALRRSGCANGADDAAPKSRRGNTVQNAGEAVLPRNWSHSSHLEGRAWVSGRALTGCYARVGVRNRARKAASGGPHRSLPREAADPSGLLPRFVPWIREI